jgi:hypothetical protein
MDEQKMSREEFNKLRKKIINKRKKLRIWKDVVLRQTNKPLTIKKGKVHGEAKQIGQFKYKIPGSKGKTYEINLLSMECSCPDFFRRRKGYPKDNPYRCCKHIDEVFAQKGISQKDWLEHLGVAESVDPEVMAQLKKFRISDQKFGRKKIKRKRNKMKKEKISSSLKKLCKKHGVRLTVKRGKKRVYKSVKVLKGQCKRKVKKKKKVKRRRRKFGNGTESQTPKTPIGRIPGVINYDTIVTPTGGTYQIINHPHAETPGGTRIATIGSPSGTPTDSPYGFPSPGLSSIMLPPSVRTNLGARTLVFTDSDEEDDERPLRRRLFSFGGKFKDIVKETITDKKYIKTISSYKMPLLRKVAKKIYKEDYHLVDDRDLVLAGIVHYIYTKTSKLKPRPSYDKIFKYALMSYLYYNKPVDIEKVIDRFTNPKSTLDYLKERKYTIAGALGATALVGVGTPKVKEKLYEKYLTDSNFAQRIENIDWLYKIIIGMYTKREKIIEHFKNVAKSTFNIKESRVSYEEILRKAEQIAKEMGLESNYRSDDIVLQTRLFPLVKKFIKGFENRRN